MPAPSAESTRTLQQAMRRLNSLPEAPMIRGKLERVFRFHINYSQTKPAIKDPELALQLLDTSASGDYLLSEVSRSFEIRPNGIYNAWDITHKLLTLILTPSELLEIGLTPAELNAQNLRIASNYDIYTQVSQRLQSSAETAEILDLNAHFSTYVDLISEGYGIRGYLQQYVGENYGEFFDDEELHFIEADFRRGFVHGVPSLNGEQQTSGASYNHNFLRRALFARYLLRKMKGTNGSELIEPNVVMSAFVRTKEITTQDTYLNTLQCLVNKLPMYESLLAPRVSKDYQKQLSCISTTEYFELYSAHNLVGYPLVWMLTQVAKGRGLMEIADNMQHMGINYSEHVIRNELSSVSRFMENVLLQPRITQLSPQNFQSAISHLHKHDIALLTAVASGKPELLEA